MASRFRLSISVFGCELSSLVLCLVFMVVTGVNLGCHDVKRMYKLKGFDQHDVPQQAISGEHLEVCSQGLSCCTGEMETTLLSVSKKEYEQYVRSTISLLKTTFASRTSKFDDFFKELLENSRKDLHEMFVRIYGLLYQQNSHIFADLFTDLKLYYSGDNLKLSEVLQKFFVRLLRRMFLLLNGHHSFRDDYLDCVVQHMKDLKPFGDVPEKLTAQVKRSFVAARTFVQGLAIGREVITTVSEIPPTASCRRALMKMMYCPHCHGLTSTKPCNNFCLNTMKGCLAYYADLNAAWNDYIDALMMVAQRLEGPFNIESVVEPIDVKISAAIMNFQDNSNIVSERIFEGCGQPDIGRKKREAGTVDPLPTDDEDAPKTEEKEESLWQYNNEDTGVKPTTAAGTSLDRLVRDIKEKIETAKDFWIQLPHALCNNEDFAAQPGEEYNCWNGQDKGRYLPAVQKDGLWNQLNNPEVDVDVTRTNALVILQIRQLKIITRRLNQAYKGEFVEPMGVDVDSQDGSGSGGGAGGHVGDDEDIDDESSGSGSGAGARPPSRTDSDGHQPGDTDRNQYYFEISSTPRTKTTTTKSSASTLHTILQPVHFVAILITSVVLRYYLR